ncbi:MAG TPA: DUF1501 domain-containing protein [Lacipirellulaceae bacterium]|nr:DUF1501 domain-containing protein [Lacipirellulaceae bacterium]
MFDLETQQEQLLRRTFLGRTSLGLGSVALAGLLQPQLLAAATKMAGPLRGPQRYHGVVNPLHFPQKAKRVIFLCMAGGPSQFETFDYKPKLAEMHGKPVPESLTKGQPIAQLQGQKQLLCFGPQATYRRYGQSGQQISNFLPHIGSIADDICIIRSMQTAQINHDPAHTYMNTGTAISGRPSMGSWITYGLGSESEDLPGFVVLLSRAGTRAPQPVSSRQWYSGFLPSKFQGVQLYSTGDPVHYVSNPPGVDRPRENDVINAVNTLNRMRDAVVKNPEIETRISQYELAFRMQMSVPELVNIANEPRHVLKMYGVNGPDGSFAYNCLLARRLAERGVRFIHLYHRGWDHHDGIRKHIPELCESSDQATAALIADLKQRGMLDETLVIWGGEFGRTPMAQGDVTKARAGRDHHIRGFTMWLAGGGIKGGVSYGETDDFGYFAVKDIVPIHDLHATMLHLMGIDHERLTFRYQGRDFRLTDVAGKVVRGILA